jgi:flagellar P-ring protein precursor FlgI
MDSRPGQEVRMDWLLRWIIVLFGCAVLALSARVACATSIQDLARLKGHERNVVTGMGIVIGLNGTGDSSKESRVAARPYAQYLNNLDNQVIDPDELLKADTYAIVNVTMEIPATGVREGDRLDVRVDTLFNAKSLAGGTLVVSLLYKPLPLELRGGPIASANGPLVIEGANPRSAVVRTGGQMLTDIFTNPVSSAGTMTLVLRDQYAGYPNAATLAGAINDEFAVDGPADLASVIDQRNIRVVLPAADRAQPASFIATVMTIAIDPALIQSEARIVINEKQGIILVTGNVEIGPVGITHRGLAITDLTSPGDAPAAVGIPGAGVEQPRRWAGMDTTDRTSRASTRLLDLLTAFDQLSVPAEDQIAIIYELKKTGALHAEIVNQ